MRRPPAGPKQWSRRFGFDLFISFKLGVPPVGSQAYASDLARKLMERDFTVFFSELEAPPGAELDTTLKHALRRSRALIVVLNEGAIQHSAWVREEIETFRRFHPERPVAVINVDSAIQRFGSEAGLDEWLGHAGKIWIDETQQAIDRGVVSEDIVSRLALTPWLQRAAVKLRMVAALLAFTLTALAAAAGIAAWQANRNYRQAAAALWAAEGRLAVDGHSDSGSVIGILKTLAAYRMLSTPATESAMMMLTQDLLRLDWISEIPKPIYGLVTTQDGSLAVASLGLEGEVAIWRTTTSFDRAVVVPACGASVIDIALNSTGTAAALACGNGQVMRISTRTGSVITPIMSGHQDRVFSVAWSPKSGLIASGGYDKSIRTWNGHTGASISARENAHDAPVSAIAVSPDGRTLVSGDYDGTLRLWTVDPLQPRSAPIRGHAESIDAIVFLPDGKSFMTVGDELIQRWSTVDGSPYGKPLSGHAGPVWELIVSRDGRFLASSGHDRTIRVWSTATGLPVIEPLRGHLDSVTALAFGPSEHQILSVSEDRTLRSWTWARSRAQIQHGPGLSEMELGPDGKLLATGDQSGKLRLWDVDTARQKGATTRAHKTSISGLAFSTDGTSLISADEDGHVRATSVPFLRDSVTLSARRERIEALTVSRDGRHVAYVEWSPDVAVLSRGSSTKRIRFSSDPDDRAYSVVFSPGQDLLAVGGLVQAVTVVDVDGSAPPVIVGSQEGPIRSLAWSPDGSLLAAADYQGIQLWRIEEGTSQGPLMVGHANKVTAMQFSPDGRRLLSGGDDGVVRIWDVDSGQPIGPPVSFSEREIVGLRLASEGTHYFVALEDGSVHRIPFFEGWAHELCQKVGRNLSRPEWQRYVSTETGYIRQCPALPVE